jgi:hypothetical protein
MANTTSGMKTDLNGDTVLGDDLGGGMYAGTWIFDTGDNTNVPWVRVRGKTSLSFQVWTPDGGTYSIDIYASPNGTDDAGKLTGSDPLTDSSHDPVSLTAGFDYIRPVPSSISGTAHVRLIAR